MLAGPHPRSLSLRGWRASLGPQALPRAPNLEQRATILVLSYVGLGSGRLQHSQLSGVEANVA
jgi:hypothetical protein